MFEMQTHPEKGVSWDKGGVAKTGECREEDEEHVGHGIGISAPYGDMASKPRPMRSEERLSLGCR